AAGAAEPVARPAPGTHEPLAPEVAAVAGAVRLPVVVARRGRVPAHPGERAGVAREGGGTRAEGVRGGVRRVLARPVVRPRDPRPRRAMPRGGHSPGDPRAAGVARV